MHLIPKVLIILAITWLLICGCSGGTSGVYPDDGVNTSCASDRNESPHQLFGLYTFTCDPALGTVDINPLRDCGFHLNAIHFLEPPAYVNISIEGTPFFHDGIVDVNIGLRHPYLGQPQFTAFDVCGIIFTHGSVSGFSDPDIVMAGEGDTRLLNADGYTRWWNPAEFPHGNNIFTYKDGLLGTPSNWADFNCTVNGYKYFAEGLEADTPLTSLNHDWRGMFGAGQKNVRHYKIDLHGGFVFNYAVDACWAFPTGGPPYNPITAFPPAANRVEAYNVVITELESDLYYEESTGYSGGDLRIRLEVWDHFNSDSNKVFGESLAGLPLAFDFTPSEEGEGYSVYDLVFKGDNLKQSGKGELLIAVESEGIGYGNTLPEKAVCAYFTHSFGILPHEPLGWARCWGGKALDASVAVEASGNGDIYVTGYFIYSVDFDPGPGEEIHSSGNDWGIFLSKFDKDGGFQWARAWGGDDGDDFGYGIAVDSFGYVYVTGSFVGLTDFDPGPGVDEHNSWGYPSGFLSKFDADGNYLWVRTWDAISRNVTVDNSGQVIVTGEFDNTVDFDPGSGVTEYTTGNTVDAYMSKFSSDGDFLWVRVWGGPRNDSGYDVVTDSHDDIYISGCFEDVVDFDPGSGVDEHVSNGDTDIFLSKFSPEGEFIYSRCWGSSELNTFEEEVGYGVDTDLDDCVYVTGVFEGPTDFDPGPVSEMRVPLGAYDPFLSKFDPSGEFLWATTWGGTGWDRGLGIVVDGCNDVYVSGFFQFTVDFDPGSGIDYHTANDDDDGGPIRDAFITKFDTNGNHLWAATWGGTSRDVAESIAVDNDDNTYTGGRFRETVDFNPGPGIEMNTSNGHEDAYIIKFPPDGNW